MSRSHVDPLLFVVFMNVARSDLDDETIEVIRAAKFSEGESFEPILSKLKRRNHQTLFHETYHFWQGLRLPFLFRYATLAFRQAFVAFKQLSQHSPDFETWDCVMPELFRLTIPARVGHDGNGKIYWTSGDADIPALTVATLTPIELLECAASLAEFQVTCKNVERADPTAFRRWTKRNGAYDTAYRFAASFLGNETLILRCLLPLINASFHTSEPTRTFVELLARMWGLFASPTSQSENFLSQPEPCRWSELFQSWVARLDYDAQADAHAEVLGEGYFRLTIEQWVGGSIGNADGRAIHPFLGLRAREWLESSKAEPALTSALDYPGWLGDSLGAIRQRFSPPLTIFRFHLGNGDDRVFHWGAPPEKPFSTLPMTGREWHGFVADLLTMYGAVRRASGSHFDANQRTCHHHVCRYHLSNYCNAYPIVPEQHTNCGFPERIERLVQIWRS